jgi:hypothetical protein
MPTSTPWGTSQISETYARGIMYYSTASHGGYHLSPTRNMVVPEYMRKADGWYEHDCEWAIAATIFPEAWVKAWGSENILKTIKETLRNWYPDFYEKFYNVEILETESHVRDRENFAEANKDNYVVICATGKEKHVEVIATKGGVREFGAEERTFLIKTEEYQNRSNLGFVIDLDRHIEI